MNIGMLWFLEKTPELTLGQKIQRAVDYYHKKYGRLPDMCLIHPSMIHKDQQLPEIKGLTVRPYRPVQQGHIWIGVEDKPDKPTTGDD